MSPSSAGNHFSPPEEIIEEIRQGRMVVVLDDEDRENEGDLIMAASAVTPEAINFMARYGRGLICLTLTSARCEQLHLPLMVADNNDKNSTNFTVSIEAAEGVTTGISAADRARTVQAAVAADARPADIVQPGHIFPLKAQPGGVLARAGHTEAGCDLARLAGLEPAAVIVEILNDDGTMARYPDLVPYAREHGLKMGTIADLIEYRIKQEKSVELCAETPFQTRHGQFTLRAYHDAVHDAVHLALIKGDIERDTPTLVRVQLISALQDMIGQRPPGHWSIDSALAKIAEEGLGVLVILNPYEEGQELAREVRHYKLRQLGVPQPDDEASNPQLRRYGLGAQILNDIGVGKMRIMAAPRKLHSLGGYHLELVEWVPLEERPDTKQSEAGAEQWQSAQAELKPDLAPANQNPGRGQN